jgi:hypothetical protein
MPTITNEIYKPPNNLITQSRRVLRRTSLKDQARSNSLYPPNKATRLPVHRVQAAEAMLLLLHRPVVIGARCYLGVFRVPSLKVTFAGEVEALAIHCVSGTAETGSRRHGLGGGTLWCRAPVG